MSNYIRLEEYLSNDKKSLISGPFGSNISSKFFVNEGIPVIRGNNLTFGETKFIDEGFVFVTEEKADELKCDAVADDIIFTAAGTIGQVGLIELSNKFDRYVISNKQIRARLNEKVCDIKFIYFILNTSFIREQIINNNTGSTIPLINLGVVRNLKLPNFDLPTQQKIAAVLSSLDDKIELNNKINAELEQMAKTLYDYWFVQFDFPVASTSLSHRGENTLSHRQDEQKNENSDMRALSGAEVPYKSSGGKMVYNETLKREIPEGWEVKKLGEVFDVSRGTLITKETSTDGNYKVVAAGLNFSYLTGTYNREKYTITVSGSGANAGFINFWTEQIFASDCTTVRGIDDYETFLGLHFLKLHQNYLFSQAKGSAQPHVYPSDIMGLNYVIPSNELKNKYGGLCFDIFEKVGNNLKQNQELAALRDWLLPMLMNGQVTVGDVENEVFGMVAESEVEYFKTVESKDDRFVLWLSNQKLAARGEIDEVVLREIFDAMDDEDQ